MDISRTFLLFDYESWLNKTRNTSSVNVMRKGFTGLNWTALITQVALTARAAQENARGILSSLKRIFYQRPGTAQIKQGWRKRQRCGLERKNRTSTSFVLSACPCFFRCSCSPFLLILPNSMLYSFSRAHQHHSFIVGRSIHSVGIVFLTHFATQNVNSVWVSNHEFIFSAGILFYFVLFSSYRLIY